MDTRKEEKRVSLKLAWASFESAKFACKNWHYSKSIPAGKMVKIGVWEDDIFKGVILFSRGANRSIGSPYGLGQDECCELTRIALTKHYTPVTKLMSLAIKMLKKQSAGLKLIVSYADMDEGHLGIIYRAGNWIYTGTVQEGQVKGWRIKGIYKHKKTWHSILGSGNDNMTYIKKLDPKAEEVRTKGKHKYLYPLDAETKRAIMKFAVAYPKSPAKLAT